MTENEHKTAIKTALTELREGIQNLQDNAGEEITKHMKALGFNFEETDDFAIAEFIEKAAGVNAESFFSGVSYNIDSLCEDICWNES